MARYVKIEDGKAVNAEEWEHDPGPDYVRSDTVAIGAEKDPQTGDLKPPEHVDPRRLIEKAVIHARLKKAGLVEDAYKLLTGDTLGRWLMPGHPFVYADDPEMLAILKTIGADVAEITAE